jgi:hypothetical protein
MTTEEQKALQDLQGLGGFRVMQSLIKAKMDKLASVMHIDKHNLVAEQTLARQLAYEVLSEFLSEINLVVKPEGETRKTYE